MTTVSIRNRKASYKTFLYQEINEKLKGVGDFLGSRPRNQEIRFRKSKEIYREKVKTNLVEMTK